jgi:uroporphyrin-III C-methyltransferase / precorrin-2 dehydrogenase / sirohydrochlorin ferrochelatase
MVAPLTLASCKPTERQAARIESLSVLPLFFDLASKQAIVVGGSAAAAWKAELLAAAGASVLVSRACLTSSHSAYTSV